MKEEKKTVAETVTETPEVKKGPETESAPKRPTFFGDQNDAIRASIRQGKHFELVRMLKTVPGKRPGDDPRFFYDYIVCIVLRGVVPFKFIHFRPYSDYIARDAVVSKQQQNSVSYAQLNFMYDMGAGLDLVMREDTSAENYNKNYPKWKFFAVATDEDGLTAEFELVPNTAGDRQFLYSAFAGFGKCRSFTWDDVKSDNPKGIKNAIMKNYLGPGEDPGVDVSDNVE